MWNNKREIVYWHGTKTLVEKKIINIVANVLAIVLNTVIILRNRFNTIDYFKLNNKSSEDNEFYRILYTR